MTTTRSKSVGRAADAARRAKHDQRTPLPPKGSKGTGNPAAEIIKDEIAKTPRKRAPRKAAAPVETPAAPVAAPEASGGDPVAADVKARRDGGATWREIAEALDLGPAKTGTSRARRLYRQANDGASAPRKEPKARTRRAAADPYADGMDQPEGERPASRSRAASMPMHSSERYRLQARDKRSKAERGGKPKMGDVNTAEVGMQQVTGLRRVFEGDGYTVTVEKRQADGTWATA